MGFFGSSLALVSVYHGDGSVSIAVGSIEMGQGLNTKVAQTAAHVLGIPLTLISVKPTNTLTTPNAIVTGASIGSEISCYVSDDKNISIKVRIVNLIPRQYKKLASS